MAADKKVADKTLMLMLTPKNRDELLRQYRYHSKDLVKLQREYKNLVGSPVHTKVELIKRQNFVKNLQHLKREKEEILANLQVALGPGHLQEYENYINMISGHVKCQGRLQRKIGVLSKNIVHLRGQQVRTDQKIYELNIKLNSEKANETRIKKAKCTREILENQLDVSKKRECALITENLRLRSHIVDMLFERSLFNKFWRKMMGHLNHDKKFLIDLVERAIDCFSKGTEACENLMSVELKRTRDIETKISEMQELVKRAYSDKFNMTFLQYKGGVRELADLEAKEYRRRGIFKQKHSDKIELYKAILDKILSFSGTQAIGKAIEKFQKQEDVFYSYFNYMNELSYQVQVLDDTLNTMYFENIRYRTLNKQVELNEMDKIAALKEKLVQEQEKTQNKQHEMEAFEQQLAMLFKGIQEIFLMISCDDTQVKAYLGDQSKITIFNVQRFLNILENQLNAIIAYIYMKERKHSPRTERHPHRHVNDVDRHIEPATNIENIVLAQQCAECVEGEDVNPYDEEFVLPKTVEEVKALLREKVTQPEMQYRLHSISQCRLPRSRLLANKRY